MEPKDTSFGASLVVPSVQELVKEPLTRIPPRYIRPDQDPPVISSSLSSNPELPIIDMKRLLSPDSVDSELEKLHLACRDWGFFQLINHEVSNSLIEKVKEETQEFFKLPLEEKKRYAQRPGDFEGFGQLFVVSEEQKLDWNDIFIMITLPSHLRKPHLLPKLPQQFRDTIEEYSKEVEKVAFRMLMFISKALRMEVEEMKSLFDDGLQILRLNYYPPCPQPEQVIGLTPHSDGVGITLLLQVNQVEGLEIKKDCNWLPVTPHPNAFIVNIGDIMEMVTNGEYRSIEHRAVVNANKERLSMATFVNPNMDGNIRPATSLVTPEKPPRYRSLPLSDYLKNRLSKKLDAKSNLEEYYI